MRKEKKSRIIGTGSYLPDFAVNNEMLCRYYSGKGPEWIEMKTGIEERRFGFDLEDNKMREGYYDDDLAEAAAIDALEKTGISASVLSLIIRVTLTPEYLSYPDPACRLHRRIGASRDCSAFTIPSGCGGLIYALKVGDDHVRANDGKTVLIVASNTPSSYMNMKDEEAIRRNWLNADIFGDGASAVLLSNNQKNGGEILASYWGAWHENDPIVFPAGGSRNPTRIENVSDHYFKMDVKAVAEYAPVHLGYAIKKLREVHNFSYNEIDWVLFHQVNLRILERLIEEWNIPPGKVLLNVDHYGNTSSASIGILLDEAIEEGKIKKGNKVLFAGVGAGWQYGAIFVRW